jgi:SAM-dependent methyltransferase
VKFLDRMLQRWRIAQARPFLFPGARVLDIGSFDGSLFEQLGCLAPGSMGIDPTLKQNVVNERFRLIAGYFPQDMPAADPFDAVTMLAVLEHFPPSGYEALREGCRRFLKPGGKVIITVPSPAVDHILKVLLALRLVHGMSLEEHHGYEVDQTRTVFPEPDFRLIHRGRFQLGLNHLFVFERTAGTGGD